MDLDENELVDEFQHVLNIVPSPNETVAKFQKFVHSGIHKSGSKLEYEIKVYCSLNYVGENCTTHCKVEKDENIFLKYIYLPDGEACDSPSNMRHIGGRVTSLHKPGMLTPQKKAFVYFLKE